MAHFMVDEQWDSASPKKCQLCNSGDKNTIYCSECDIYVCKNCDGPECFTCEVTICPRCPVYTDYRNRRLCGICHTEMEEETIDPILISAGNIPLPDVNAIMGA